MNTKYHLTLLMPLGSILLLFMMSMPQQAWAKSSLSGYEIRKLVVEEAMDWGVEPELALAVARIESNFDASAISHAGARGVMQIMPATAMGEFGVPKYRLYHPETNVRIGVRYLKQLLEQYDHNEQIALSHYNGGSKVRRSNGTLAVIPATQRYVNKVLAQKARYASHSLVIAAKRGNLNQGRRLAARSQLDDFGRYGPITQRKPLLRTARTFHTTEIEPSDERASLVRKLRSLKFKNNYRAVTDYHFNFRTTQPLDDF